MFQIGNKFLPESEINCLPAPALSGSGLEGMAAHAAPLSQSSPSILLSFYYYTPDFPSLSMVQCLLPALDLVRQLRL